MKKTSPYKRAREVFGALDPKWATKGGGKEAYIEEAERYRTFQADYRAAWDRWASGDRDVAFPYGTWLMRVRHGARCAGPPSSRRYGQMRIDRGAEDTVAVELRPRVAERVELQRKASPRALR